jgi:hypothetical protein
VGGESWWASRGRLRVLTGLSARMSTWRTKPLSQQNDLTSSDRLKEVNASMGLMLEQAVPLPAVHRFAPSKLPVSYLRLSYMNNSVRHTYSHTQCIRPW